MKDKIGQQQDIECIRRTWRNPWFHGTDHTSAMSILARGPQISPGNIGTAFCVSDKYNAAYGYAKSMRSKYHICDPQPYKAVEITYFAEVLLDTFYDHAERLSTHKNDPNSIQHWALNNGYKAHGHFMNLQDKTEMKLAIYDPGIIQVVKVHIHNET